MIQVRISLDQCLGSNFARHLSLLTDFCVALWHRKDFGSDSHASNRGQQMKRSAWVLYRLYESENKNAVFYTTLKNNSPKIYRYRGWETRTNWSRNSPLNWCFLVSQLWMILILLNICDISDLTRYIVYHLCFSDHDSQFLSRRFTVAMSDPHGQIWCIKIILSNRYIPMSK